jgi:hypothetical protein
MATIQRDVAIDAPAAHVWSAIRAVGEVHDRLAPGFVVDCRVEGDARVVTFVNGTVARELLVDVDDEGRRVAYAVVESPLGMTHHHASMRVVAGDDQHSTVVWIADLLPDDAAATIGQMMDEGARAMQQALAVTPAGRPRPG